MANAANKQFLGDLSELCNDADSLPGAKRSEMLRGILQHVEARDIAQLSYAPADEIEFTAEQWTKIADQVKLSLGSATAEA